MSYLFDLVRKFPPWKRHRQYPAMQPLQTRSDALRSGACPAPPMTTEGIRRPTMADVGRLAGVSATTVSFVINARPGEVIRPATRLRVLAAVEELGYRPNRAAQGLRTRSTGSIGFITDEVAVESFAGQIITGAHDVAWRNGSVLLVINTMRSRAVTRAALDNLMDRQVDSIIFAAAGTRRVTLPPTVGRAPTILVNCFTANGSLPSVLPDEVTGGRSAARILIDAGHTNIAYLTGVPGGLGDAGAAARLPRGAAARRHRRPGPDRPRGQLPGRLRIRAHARAAEQAPSTHGDPLRQRPHGHRGLDGVAGEGNRRAGRDVTRRL